MTRNLASRMGIAALALAGALGLDASEGPARAAEASVPVPAPAGSPPAEAAPAAPADGTPAPWVAVSAAASRAALIDAGFTAASTAGPAGAVHYFSGGRAGAPLVVFVHGTGSQAADWHRVVPLLTDRWRVVLMDLPGHGESGPATGALPVSLLADSLGVVLAAEAAGGKATLVGNSLGGWVALLHAARHPEGVERVVGVSSSGIYAPLQVPLQPKNRDQARVLAAAIRGPNVTAATDAELDGMVANIAAGPVSRLVAGLVATDFLEHHAASVTVPVDLLWGEHDGVLPPAYGERLASLLPRARLHRLPGCGHMPQVHCAATFGPALAAVLASPPAP